MDNADMKILVGSPVSKHHAYCTHQYLERIKNLDYSGYDILLVDNSDDEEFYNLIREDVPIVHHGYGKPTIKDKLVASRNYLRDYALKNDYDYFLNIDQDVVPPKDVIERLLSHKKDFVTGIYYNYFNQTTEKTVKMAVAYIWFTKEEEQEMKSNPELVKKTNPNLYAALQKTNWQFEKLMRPINEKEVAAGKLMKIRAAGSGCMLVSRHALESVAFRENTEGGFDDVLFCFDLQDKGFGLYADCTVICEHLTQNRPWEWTRHGNETRIVYK